MVISISCDKQVINNAMQKEKDNLCIGILDIYGFESIKVSLLLTLSGYLLVFSPVFVFSHLVMYLIIYLTKHVHVFAMEKFG